MPPFITYALLFGCLVILIVGIAIERRPGKYQRWAWVPQIMSFVLAYLIVRPGRGTDQPHEVLDSASAAHTPVFLDLYSNY
jgi:hypothetical protein